MNHPKFLIHLAKDKKFFFRLTATNGQNILGSEAYTSKSGCKNGIESVKKHAPDDANYNRLEAKNGEFYFTLEAANNQVIGTSEMYQSKQARDNGIESVKTNAPEAGVEDTTA